MSSRNTHNTNNRKKQQEAALAAYERERAKRAARKRAEKLKRKRARRRRFVLFCAVMLIALIAVICTALRQGKSYSTPAANYSGTEYVPTESAAAPLEPETEPPEPVSSEEGEPIQSRPISSEITPPSFDNSTKNLSGDVRSEYAILVDVNAGRVVASRGANKKVYPASLTKVMSLVTAYEHISDIDNEYFTMTFDILNPLIVSGNSLAGFEVGESVSMREYMYGMIMPSGADAAEAIAAYCGGGISGFADMMNKKARQIGLSNSHFSNPVGDYDKNNYSTVYDLAVLLAYAYRYPDLADILNTYKHTTPSTEYHKDGIYFESNLQQRMKGDESGTCNVLGGKTGYTSEAGHCVMCYATSKKDGKPYVFVSCKGKAMYDPINDCIDVLKKYVD